MNELDEEKLHALAIAAEEYAIAMGIDPEQAFNTLREGTRKIPELLQTMIDTVVAMQDEFPMPEEGWKSFIEDIEYTNQKHGLNLHIKSELLE